MNAGSLQNKWNMFFRGIAPHMHPAEMWKKKKKIEKMLFFNQSKTLLPKLSGVHSFPSRTGQKDTQKLEDSSHHTSAKDKDNRWFINESPTTTTTRWTCQNWVTHTTYTEQRTNSHPLASWPCPAGIRTLFLLGNSILHKLSLFYNKQI